MLNWEEYVIHPQAEDAYRACRTLCREDYSGLRQVISRLATDLRPRSVACLGAGVLNDIPYRELVASGAAIHLVDWLPGIVDVGIAQSIIAASTPENPSCAYCALAVDDAQAFCQGYHASSNGAGGVCDGFAPTTENDAGCAAFQRGSRPMVHYRDATGGYASSFARQVPDSLADAGTWKQAMGCAGKAARRARRQTTPLDIPDGSIDLITSSMLISQFDKEPYTYFSRQAASRLGKPTDRDERQLQSTTEALRFELFTAQAERHCDEIKRIMAPGGRCLFAFEMFQRDAADDGWFLVRECHAALEIMESRFAFDFDALSPRDMITRVEVGAEPSLVQVFLVRHKSGSCSS